MISYHLNMCADIKCNKDGRHEKAFYSEQTETDVGRRVRGKDQVFS